MPGCMKRVLLAWLLLGTGVLSLCFAPAAVAAGPYSMTIADGPTTDMVLSGERLCANCGRREPELRGPRRGTLQSGNIRGGRAERRRDRDREPSRRLLGDQQPAIRFRRRRRHHDRCAGADNGRKPDVRHPGGAQCGSNNSHSTQATFELGQSMGRAASPSTPRTRPQIDSLIGSNYATWDPRDRGRRHDHGFDHRGAVRMDNRESEPWPGR